MARQIVARKGFPIVGAVDIDPLKVGQDVGAVIGTARKLRVKVGVDIGKTIKASNPTWPCCARVHHSRACFLSCWRC